MRGEELFKYLVCCTLSNLEQVPAALAAIDHERFRTTGSRFFSGLQVQANTTAMDELSSLVASLTELERANQCRGGLPDKATEVRLASLADRIA